MRNVGDGSPVPFSFCAQSQIVTVGADSISARDFAQSKTSIVGANCVRPRAHRDAPLQALSILVQKSIIDLLGFPHFHRVFHNILWRGGDKTTRVQNFLPKNPAEWEFGLDFCGQVSI